MKEGKVEVVMVLDRSGSMDMPTGSAFKPITSTGGLSLNTRATDLIEEYNKFIEEQKKVEGECYITVYRFDNEIERIVDMEDVHQMERIGYDMIEPRGSTSLYDAIGEAINDVGKRLSETDESERPEKVVVGIITDGGENSSVKFTHKEISELIKHQEEKYNWSVLFLSEDISAVNDASRYMNTISNTSSVHSVSHAMNKMSDYTRKLRSSENYNMTLADVDEETEETE